MREEQEAVPDADPDSTAANWSDRLCGQVDRKMVVVTVADGHIAGFVSESDFIRATIPSATDIAIYESIITEKELPEQMVRNLRFTKVEDIMTSNIVTIDADEPVLNALALLHVHNLKRLPVLENGKLVGTIGRADILKNLLIDRPLSEVI